MFFAKVSPLAFRAKGQGRPSLGLPGTMNMGNLRSTYPRRSRAMRAGTAVCLLLTAAVVAAEPPKTNPPPAPVEVTLDGLKATAPAAWKPEKPANLLRPYQFKLTRAD